MEKFTIEETNVILQIISRTTVSPLEEDAARKLELLQSIARKARANTETDDAAPE